MSYFRTPRCVELSIIYYLETQIQSAWTGVSIVKSFNQAYDKPLPVVCIRLLNDPVSRLEIGDNTLKHDYNFVIDIFAKSDGQRLDLADFIIDKLKDGCTYYLWSHASGDNSVLDKVESGTITVASFLENGRVEFGQDVESQDKFRHIISFSVRKF